MERGTLIARKVGLAVALLLALGGVDGLSGQQGAVPPDSGAAVSPEAAARLQALRPPAGETSGDTISQDTLSPRARALARLRALTVDPVEVVPEAPDTAAEEGRDTAGTALEAAEENRDTAAVALQELAEQRDTAIAALEVAGEGPDTPVVALREAAEVGEEGPDTAAVALREAVEEVEERAPPGAAQGVEAAEVREGVAQRPAAIRPGQEAVAQRPAAVPPGRLAGPEASPRPAGRRPGVAPDDTLAGTRTPGPDRIMRADSVVSELRALEGYAITEYTGESAVFEVANDQLVLTGQSRVAREGSALETDSLLVYSGETGVVCGYGAPVLSGEVDPVESSKVCFDIDRKLGVATGARTSFQQQATWYVRGAENRVYLLTGGEQTTLYGEGAEFTSCEAEHPHYTFRAKSVKMVEEGSMVARDITLRFADVPVFWLPWMVQSMKRGRRSGLLMPQFGVNDIVRNSSGYNRHLSNLGFYWAVNDYVSARGTFEWYSNNWTAVEGALSYRWLRQFLEGSVTAKRYWRQVNGELASKEFTLNTSNSWRPDERTRIQLNANFATSHDFVRDYSFDPRELNRRITSSASINRSFSWGSVSLGADRSEQLSTGQVDLELPGVSLNISPITLLDFGEGRGLSWSGSGSYNRRTRTGPADLGIRNQETTTASYSHRFNLANLGLAQRINWSDAYLGVQPADTATGKLEIPEESTQRMGWSTTLSYQQVLWPGTTLSPSVQVGGNSIRDERTAGAFVAEPNRVSAGASINTAVFGFWPGFGNYSRIRHKIAPSIRWSYSPAPEVTELQQEIFGTNPGALREQNQISLSFNQTFEAKVKEPEAAPGDSLQADEAGAGQGDDPGAPRRRPQAEKVMLLALDTRTSFVYDFVAAREDGRGFQTRTISNSIRSDLLRGLQLTATHDLFEGDEGVVNDSTPRKFAPALTNLTASFSIDQNFWLFRLLGLSGADAAAADQDLEDEEEVDPRGGMASRFGAESSPDDMPGGMGSMVPARGSTDSAPRVGGRGWRASLNYTLQRSRPGQAGTAESQLLSGNLSFEPTELWSVRWSTAYSFTDGEFANHVLTLSRDLHRWQANFDFIKAQNGNFAMQFRVQLRDNPDLKVDYDQRSGPSDRYGTRRGGIR